MSSTSLIHSVPLLVIAAVFALVFLFDRKDVKKPTRYHLGDPWTHEPILWNATSEPVPLAHAADDAKGGTASGRW